MIIRRFATEPKDGSKVKKWKVWLEPEIKKLFSSMNFSKIIWEQRLKLTPLAKWLHSYYSSHVEPHPIKVETLHKACGSRTKALKHFKPLLRKALLELVRVGFLTDYHIDPRSLVFVVRYTQNKIYENTGA